MSRETLQSLGEFGLIERLCASLGSLPDNLIGPGDDCAVVPLSALSPGASGFQVLTTDTIVEGRHFRLETASPYDIGWKCAAATLSDIAAMGAEARYLLLSLQLRPELEPVWLDELYRGIGEVCRLHGALVLGGDVVSGSELAFNSTGIGFTAHAPILRSGAKVGDRLWVSGPVGRAALGLALLEGRVNVDVPDKETFLAAHRRPEPRLDIGRLLSASGKVTSCIDISDGLLQDAGHLARKSSVDLVIDLDTVPRPGVLSDAELLTGGEDYELLFTADSSFIGPSGTVCIGRIVEPSAAGTVHVARREGPLLAASEFAKLGGFDHFRS